MDDGRSKQREEKKTPVHEKEAAKATKGAGKKRIDELGFRKDTAGEQAALEEQSAGLGR